MYPIQFTLQLLLTLLPTLCVLGYLLLRRRMSHRAELELARLRLDRWDAQRSDQAKRHGDLLELATGLVPLLAQFVSTKLDPPSVREIPNAELAAELGRRIDDGEWDGDNPFASLDDLLERMWAEGVDLPASATGEHPSPTIPDLTGPDLGDLLEAVP